VTAKTVLLTDIDNTLYDWPAFFAPCFRAMVHALSKTLRLDENELYDDFKSVFAHHRSLEYPFAIQELKCVQSFPTWRVRELVAIGRGAFKSVQRKRLRPYDGVIDTLQWLRIQDIDVIAVTNAPAYRAQHRLYDLRLDTYLHGLVAWEGFESDADDITIKGFVEPGRIRKASRLKPEQILMVPEELCKPSERHYSSALEVFGINATQAWAIGDSRAKDLEPAATLGIRTIWAQYGSQFDPNSSEMSTLLRITHWDDSRISSTYKEDTYFPDATVQSFASIREILPVKYPSLF
jgi:FMN phosphatase YigB (HAD superfamily)